MRTWRSTARTPPKSTEDFLFPAERSRSPMIYFDITDLFNYLGKNRHVTGIQRVQTKILHALAVQAPEQVKCLVAYSDASTQARIVVYSVSDLFTNEAQTPSLIRELLRQKSPKRLLDPAGVRAALQPYSHRKLHRGIRKLELYASRLLAPRRLARLGYQEDRMSTIPPIRAEPFAAPRANDRYVLLGHNWSTPGIDALASSFRHAGGRSIQVIHDIIPAKEPAFFPTQASKDFQHYLRRCQKTFDTFIAVSENTCRDLLNHFDGRLRPSSVHVLRLAHAFSESQRNAECSAPSSEALSALKNKPFVVSVGTIEPRKNHVILIRVWRRLHEQLGEETPTLVIAGKLGWKTEAFMEHMDAARREGVPLMYVSSVSDRDLHFLYSHCRFSVYPSLYEGWGLPVGESLWLGRPCLASNAASIPEISSNGVQYFDPRDDNDLFDQVYQLCRDNVLLDDLTRDVKSADLRDWSHVAQDLMHILESRVSGTAAEEPPKLSAI